MRIGNPNSKAVVVFPANEVSSVRAFYESSTGEEPVLKEVQALYPPLYPATKLHSDLQALLFPGPEKVNIVVRSNKKVVVTSFCVGSQPNNLELQSFSQPEAGSDCRSLKAQEKITSQNNEAYAGK